MSVIQSIHSSGGASTVQFDDGASFRCTHDFARRSQLQRGQTIDAVFVDRLRRSASLDLACSEAERLNRRGKYSRRQLVQRLIQEGMASHDVEEALDQLDQRGELDDAAVALKIVRRGLAQDLQRAGDHTWISVRQRHVRRLRMRGFDTGTAIAAVREAWSEREGGD